MGCVWCGVCVWFSLVLCGVVWCGVCVCGVVWCGLVWCCVVGWGVMWCGLVWCVVACDLVWCSVSSSCVLIKSFSITPADEDKEDQKRCCIYITAHVIFKKTKVDLYRLNLTYKN